MGTRFFVMFALCLTQACTSGNLNHALGAPKNPLGVYSYPTSSSIVDAGELDLLTRRYDALRDASQNLMQYPVRPEAMRPYLANGYWVAEFYCAKFLNKTDEAYRRRSFGRSATNDVGTVVQSLLNLAHAGKNAVTGVGVATGLADSMLRHYDSAFLISPELGNVKALVRANMKNYRSQTLGPSAALPLDWATAQSAVLEYADMCSFTGLQELLNRSASDLRRKLNSDTKENNQQPSNQQGTVVILPEPRDEAPDADPPLSSNGPAAALGDVTRSLAFSATPATVAFVGRWGDKGDHIAWSAVLVQAVAELGNDLAKADFIPVDIGEYCPAYMQVDSAKRQLAWAGMLSALARPESDFDPAAKLVENMIDADGQPVVSRGLLQISQESANSYGCGIADAVQLHDPTTNLRCGVRIMSRLVTRDGVVSERIGNRWKGAAAYWHPFRVQADRAEISSWLAQQPYCAVK